MKSGKRRRVDMTEAERELWVRDIGYQRKGAALGRAKRCRGNVDRE